MKKLKKIASNILFVISIFVFVIAAYFTITAKIMHKDSFFFGFKPYVIVSESMDPTIKKYGIIIIKKVNYNKIVERDIITYKLNENTNVCHRVTNITNQGFITKGDNSKVQDLNYVTEDNFVGKVIFISNILANYLQFYNTNGIFLAVIAPVLSITLFITAMALFRKNEK